MTRTTAFEVIANSAISDVPPAERQSAQWDQAVGLSRLACARIFRDGGRPADAVRAFGLTSAGAEPADWSKAVHLIAESICAPRLKRAA